MSRNNRINTFDIVLTRTEQNEDVFISKGRVSARLNVVPENFEIARHPITEIQVLRLLNVSELSKLKTRIQQHAKYVLTNVAYEFLNKSKELKLLSCLAQDVAYINYLRNIHWIEVIEHIHFNRQTEKNVHKETISKVKDITANLIKDNDELLAKSLWVFDESYHAKLVDLDLRMMKLKMQIFTSLSARDAAKSADGAQNVEQTPVDQKKLKKQILRTPLEVANIMSPSISDKNQIEALTKIDIKKISLKDAYGIFKFLQAQAFDYKNATELKKWDKQHIVKSLQAAIRAKFYAYNPENLADNLNAKYDVVKEKLNQELQLGRERLKNQSLITKEQINEYEKHNLTREEDFYWWKYAEIYKCANAKLNRNIALQNLYVQNLFWKIQDHNKDTGKEVEFKNIPGLLQPLKFASEVKLNLSNFDNKIKLANEKTANDPSLAIEVYNEKCDVEALDTLYILSKFKNVKSFQLRTALLRELAQLKYDRAIRNNKLQYEKLKEQLKLNCDERIKALNKSFADESTVNQLLEIRHDQEIEKANQPKIEAEKK